MTAPAAKGSWVEIHSIILPAGARAPQVPEDTKQVPLEMRVKGFLVESANMGQDVEIITAAGRHLHGVLVEINPGYTHSFGIPIAELSVVGEEVRAILRERGRVK
jgi:hypothetical protein